MRKTSRDLARNATRSQARIIGPRLVDFLAWRVSTAGACGLGGAFVASQFPALSRAEVERAIAAFVESAAEGASLEETRSAVEAALCLLRRNAARGRARLGGAEPEPEYLWHEFDTATTGARIYGESWRSTYADLLSGDMTEEELAEARALPLGETMTLYGNVGAGVELTRLR